MQLFSPFKIAVKCSRQLKCSFNLYKQSTKCFFFIKASQYGKTKNLNSDKLTQCISYFKRAEWVLAALLGGPLVVVKEIGYVLWRQGDPTVVEEHCRWFEVGALRPLRGDGRKHDAQHDQEQHSQVYTDM